MPLKKKPMPAPNGNILLIQLYNTVGSSANETARSTPVDSELPSKF